MISKFLAALLLFFLPSLGWAAISCTTLTNGGNTTCNSGGTTASIAPASNALVLVTFGIEGSPAGTGTATGNSLTYEQVNTTTSPNGDIRVYLFRAQGASPTSGAITFSTANESNCTWAVIECTGVAIGGNGADAIVQSAVNSAAGGSTSLSVTLSAFEDATNNVAVGAFQINNNVTVTPGSGFSEVGTQTSCCGSRTMMEAKTGQDTGVDITFTSSQAAGVAVELREPIADTIIPQTGMFVSLLEWLGSWLAPPDAFAAIPTGASSDPRFALGYLVCDYYSGVADDDATDGLTGIQACIDDAIDNQLTAFLEGCGTYRVSNTLTLYKWQLWNPSTGQARNPSKEVHVFRGTHSCGAGVRPTIKLTAGASGFSNAAAPRPIIAVRNFVALNSSATSEVKPSDPLDTPANFYGVNTSGASSSNQTFYHVIEGLNFDTATHAGAIGVLFPGAQGSSLIDTKITATSSYAGIYGLPDHSAWSGGIEVIGGQYCVLLNTITSVKTFNTGQGTNIVGLTCTSPTVAALNFLNHSSPLVITGLSVTKSSDGPSILANSAFALIDAKFTLSGSAADDAVISNVNNRNAYIREMYITGATKFITSGGTTTTGSGTWAKLIEYVYNDQFSYDGSSDPAVFPTYTLGASHLEARSVINGVLGSASLPIVSKADDVTAPASDLVTRHLWTAIPSFEDGTYLVPSCTAYIGIDPTTNNTGQDCTSALQTAIDDAATAGHNRVHLPRGSIYLTGGVTLSANTKLMGAGPTKNFLSYKSTWAPVAAVPFLTSADSASGTAYVGFFSIYIRNTPLANDFQTFLKWRTGKSSMTMSLHPTAGFISPSTTNQPRYKVEVTGNGGGKHYGTTQDEGWQYADRNLASRSVYVHDNTEPLTFYGCNLEAGKTVTVGANIEISNSTAGFRCYGIKRESNAPTIIVTNSQNVGLFGVGAMKSPSKSGLGGYHQVTGTSNNILFANLTPLGMPQSANGEFMLREDIGAGSTGYVPWPTTISIYKRGEIDDAPFTAGETPVNPPRFQSATVNAVDTTDICFETFDGATMLPATGVTGFSFTVNAAPETPTGVVRQGENCFRATFTASTITVNTDVVIVSYAPGNITAGGAGTPAAEAFSNKTADNLLSGATVPVLAMSGVGWSSFLDSATSPTWYYEASPGVAEENVLLRTYGGSRFIAWVRVVNSVAQAATGPLVPYVTINGAGAVPLPASCAVGGAKVAFADAPNMSDGETIAARALPIDETEFTPGAVIESTAGAATISWSATIPSETNIAIPIETCAAANLGDDFIIRLYGAGGVPFVSYDDNLSPRWDRINNRSFAEGGGRRQ